MKKLTSAQRAWVLYDVGNSAFSLIITTALMPVFFKTIAAGNLSSADSTAMWGFTVSVASVVTAFLAPFLGAVADYKGLKKRFFVCFVFVGIAAVLSFSFVTSGMWFVCLLLYFISRIAFASGNIFYDAFLPDVASKKDMDMVSSYGFGYGYIGSVIPFVVSLALLFYFKNHSGSAGFPLSGYRVAFVVTALWWAFFSIPLVRRVKHVHYLSSLSVRFSDTFGNLLKVFNEIRSRKNLILFLAAYFFYIDGVYTVISMAMAYGIDQKFSQPFLIAMILMIQVAAWPCALFFGRLSRRFSPKRMILTGLLIYVFIVFVAFSLPWLSRPFFKKVAFIGMALMVASAQGGIQAISRSFFASMIPPQRSAEFFGFYNVFGKFAAVMGPAFMAFAVKITGESRYGVLSLLFLFITGIFFLVKVKTSES